MEDTQNEFDFRTLLLVLVLWILLIIDVFDVFGSDDTTNPPVNAYGNTNLFGFSWYQPESNSTTTQSGYTYLTFSSYYLDKSYLVSFTDKNKYTYIYFAIPVDVIDENHPLNFGYLKTIFNHYNGKTNVFINDDRNFCVYSDKQVLSSINVDNVDYYYYREQISYDYYQYMVTQSLPNYDLNCPLGADNVIRYMVSNNTKYLQEYDSDMPYFVNLNVKFNFYAENVLVDDIKSDTPVITSFLKSIELSVVDSLLSDGTNFSFDNYDLECYLSSQFSLYKEESWFFNVKREKLSSSVYTTSIRPFVGSFDVGVVNENFLNFVKGHTDIVSPMFESNYKANFNTLQFCIRLKKGGKYGKWYSLTYDYEKKTATALILLPIGSSESTLTNDSYIKDVAGSATSNGGWQQGNSDFNTGTSVGGNPSNNGSGTGDVNDLVSFIGNVPSVIGVIFSWLPPWVLALIGTSIAIIVTFAVAKAFL